MIGALRRLLGLGTRMKLPRAAPFGDALLLVVSRRRSIEVGRLRASGSFGRYTVSIREIGEGEDPAPRATALGDLLESLASRLDPQTRSDLLEFLIDATAPDLEKFRAVPLAVSLRASRELLRQRLPELVIDLTASQIVMIDAVMALDERSFWIGGWCLDTEGTLADLEVVSPEGLRARVLEGSFRYFRADVEESLASVGIRTSERTGFAKYVELPFPSPLNDGWIGRLQKPGGGGFELSLPRVTRDSVTANERIMGELSVERPDSDVLRREHARPGLARLQEQMVKSVTIAREVQHGSPPQEPEISILVPLYERIDLVEHQIAHFWEDPDTQAAELIYVLDSPALSEPLARLAGPLHDLYGLPFKIIELSRNAGFSTANNIGAANARGRLLLLLNSDVLPVRDGWLSRLRAFYDATPQIGALGPKLLYEDDSLQHAGMYFQRDAESRFWENQHYFKGFSRSLPAANVSRPVPAVTGACLMIERALYEDIGGLSSMYLRGGYEDSDLCLRLIEAGRRNWYLADLELYHLEAQSFPIHFRSTNRYNAWLQTDVWDARIAQTMSEQPAAADARVVAIG
jgi:GT2 family glycosyltransferase